MDISNLPEPTKDLILGGLLYFQRVRQQYIAMMKGNTSTLLDPTLSSPYADVERTIKLYISADVKTPYQAIVSRILDNIKRLPPANVTYRTKLVELLGRLSNKEHFSEQLCEKQLQEVNRYVVVIEATAKLKQMNSVPQLREILTGLNQRLGRAEKPGKLTFYDPIASADKLLRHVEKVPTGISFIDTLLGGGLTWGEHGGCLGPSSGGKSIIANMLACNIAIQGYSTLLMQFEQSMENNSDIVSRVYSYLTGLSTKEFRNKAEHELSDTARQALARCRKISSRIRMTSFVDSDVVRSVDSIISAIEDLEKEQGFTPRLVIIDWLGAIVTNFMGAGGGENKAYPILAQQIQDDLITYGTQRGISFLFLHQSSIEAAKKPSGYKPTMHDSYYFGGFAQKLNYCIQIGTKNAIGDSKFALWLGCGKVRDAEPGKYSVVLMNGEYAKLEATKEGEFVISKGQLVPEQALMRVKGDTDSAEYSGGEMSDFINSYSR